MTRPPVTYACSLHDLTLFADAACYLDSYKDTCSADSVERANVLALLCRVHEAVERISGSDAHLIYASDDEPLAEGAL